MMDAQLSGATAGGGETLTNTPVLPVRANRTLPLLLAATALAILFSAWLLWRHRHHQAVEPSPPKASVLIPTEAEPNAPVLAKAAVAAATRASSAADSFEETLASLREMIRTLVSRQDANEAVDRKQDEQISALRSDLDRLIADQQSQREAAAQHPTVTKVPPVRRHIARAAATAPAPVDAAVLAVDLWGGQPSVVVSRGGGASGEVRFLSQGESQGRVTLKRGDVSGQRATFSTPTGEFTLGAGEH